MLDTIECLISLPQSSYRDADWPYKSLGAFSSVINQTHSETSLAGYVRSVTSLVTRSNSVVKTSDSRLRQTGYVSCVAVSNHGQVDSVCIAPVHSAIWVSTWL